MARRRVAVALSYQRELAMQQIDPNRSASLAASGTAEWTDADCTDRRQKAKTPARVAEQYSRLMGELGGQPCRPPRLAAG